MNEGSKRFGRVLGGACFTGLLVAVNVAGCSGSDTVGSSDDAGADGQGLDGTTSDVTTGSDGSSTVDGSGGGCPSPLSTCGTSCVDERNDPDHCGGCDTKCDTGKVCVKGACATVCPAGQVACDVSGKPRCVTTDTDRQNCGACGKACNSGEVCSGGVCTLSCSTNYTACSGKPYVPPPPDGGVDGGDAGDAGGDASDAMSVSDAMSDAASDAMGDAMISDAMADADAGDGAVTYTPYCANLKADENNCGACGLACNLGQECSRGLCCAPPTENCGGSCVDTRWDPNNCGSCGNVCPNDKPHCGNGTCTSLYTFTGVKNDIALSDITGGGWTQCYLDKYNNNDTSLAADIQAACTQGNILLACRATGSSTLHVAAHAPRTDVFFDTGTSNTTHSANGVGWYFNGAYSMGFAGDGDPVARTECDTDTSPNNTYRLCFHTLPSYGAGYRCGEFMGLNGSTAYERIIFQAN